MNITRIGAAALLGCALVATPALSATATTWTGTTTLFRAAWGNQQGLATSGHFTWVSYDVGGGKSVIRTYHWNGGLVGTSPLLSLGHAAELDYRIHDHHLYVANGGLQTETTAGATKVFQVALNANGVATKVTKTFDFGSLGENGMVAVDNTADRMLVMGGPDAGPWTIDTADFTGVVKKTITVADPGVTLQGIGVVQGALWLYVSDHGSRIDKFTLDGIPTGSRTFGFTGEAEGLTVNPGTGSVYIGAHSPNRVMRVVREF